MKYGMDLSSLLGLSPTVDDIVHAVQEAERIGFHSVLVGEHILIPADIDTSVYPAGTFEPRKPWYDPLVFLAALSGLTKTLRLGTGIAVVPYRPPIQQAQAIATLDFMSGGRFFYGAGVGWMREEFEALGVPFGERGQRTDEYLEVMKLIWSGSGAAYHGRFIDFAGGRINPLPVQTPHPPIIIGGETPPAFRRMTKYGDGFYINWKTLPEFRSMLEDLAATMAKSGRQMSELYKLLAATDIGLVRAEKDKISDYEYLGLDEIVYSPSCYSVQEGMEAMETFASEIINC